MKSTIITIVMDWGLWTEQFFLFKWSKHQREGKMPQSFLRLTIVSRVGLFWRWLKHLSLFCSWNQHKIQFSAFCRFFFCLQDLTSLEDHINCFYSQLFLKVCCWNGRQAQWMQICTCNVFLRSHYVWFTLSFPAWLMLCMHVRSTSWFTSKIKCYLLL